MASASLTSILHRPPSTNSSRHARQNLPHWQLESLVCELPRVPSSAGICCQGTLNSICLLLYHFASATVDRICYPGMLNSICLFSFHSASAAVDRTCCLGPPNHVCLFSFHFASVTVLDHALLARSTAFLLGNLNLFSTNLLLFHRQPGICYLGRLNRIFLLSFHFASATVGWICYLGTFNSICLFSFHSASATVGQLCYQGTPNSICLFSFHFASATISRHAWPQLPLWQLESLARELACTPPSAGIWYLGTLNEICLFSFHFAHCIGQHRPDHAISARSGAFAPLATWISCTRTYSRATVSRDMLSRLDQRHLPFRYNFTLATADWISYLGMLNSICLFSFQTCPAWAPSAETCYLGLPGRICLSRYLTRLYMYCSDQWYQERVIKMPC